MKVRLHRRAGDDRRRKQKPAHDGYEQNAISSALIHSHISRCNQLGDCSLWLCSTIGIPRFDPQHKKGKGLVCKPLSLIVFIEFL